MDWASGEMARVGTTFKEEPSLLQTIFKTLPKALRTQALTALTKNFGLVGLVRWVWLGRFGLVGLVW